MINNETLAAAERLSRHSQNAMQRFASGKSPAPSAKVLTHDQKTPEQPATSAPAVPSNERLLAEYERSAELRYEFMTFEAYAAFKRAEARGAFRLLRRVA